MIAPSFSTMWNALAAGLANHLWQSTLIAVAAALLTLLLRKHHARARYWLWLAASLKFLVPFSWLVSIGRHLAWSRAPIPPSQPAFYFEIDQIAHPFSPAVAPLSHAALPSSASPGWAHWLPALGVLWLCGFFVVLVLWTLRWRRISAALKSAKPLFEGREVGALRRIERLGGIRKPITLLLSHTSLEPGIFGIARPVLLWPQGISPRLGDAHLEAILAHEVWHVRRRDNLYAALHMLVEAVFWFYPLIWWLGGRLLDERERACDEEVLELGSDRHVYAESILKVCEFCLSSPLVCVSGVTGADLKQRMVHIMSDRILHPLDFARKLLLTAAAFLAIAIPITFGVLHATPIQAQSQAASSSLPAPLFSSVSVKEDSTSGQPNRQMMFSLQDGSFMARRVTLQRLIEMAYHVQDSQISGSLDLLNKPTFDVDVRLDPSYVAAMRQQTSNRKNFDDQAVLKSLLASQFKLAAHFEARTLPAYDLVVDENGAKLQPSGSEPRMMRFGRGELASSGSPLELLAEQLSARLGRPVVDKTGLKGIYTFNLHWTPDSSEDERLQASGEPLAPEPPADPNAPSLTTALEQQLGLKLQPNTERVQVLVIDHAEMPVESQAEFGGSKYELLHTPVRVPQEVIGGLIREKVPPQYPEAARDAHIQGTVVLDATIGKTGDVENLQIISGHPQLAPAAIDAVKNWKYNPFLVNGEPVDVEGQVRVTFTLSE